MLKRAIIFLLAVSLVLCSFVACTGGDDDNPNNDKVIDIGTEKLTYTDAQGDTFTYDYLNSTTVSIISFAGTYEPHLVTIPATIDGRAVVAIGDEAFHANSGISALKIEAKLETIGEYAFANCEVLTSVTFPSTLKSIGKGAFYGCLLLNDCKFPESLNEIGDYAFWGCEAMEEFTFPASLKTVGAGAFAYCTALTKVAFPDGIEAIGAQAFYGCDAIKSISLPASLTEIGDCIFAIELIKQLAEEEGAIQTVKDSAAAKYMDELH